MSDPEKNWFQTASGKKIAVDCPDPAVVDIADIAIALSRICRFGGHLRSDIEHYSVAQHSLLVSEIVPSHLRFPALLHDAAEAYLGDVVRPLKLLLPDYVVIEKAWELAIGEHFGLGSQLSDMDPAIKDADDTVLNTERRDLLEVGPASGLIIRGLSPMVERIVPMSIRQARWSFAERFWELTG
jgi:uncharacterized protein